MFGDKEHTCTCLHDNIADTVPKNHYRENLKRIQKIQAQSKEKQMEVQKPVTVLRKFTKYGNVPPKITVFMQVCHTFLYYLASER